MTGGSQDGGAVLAPPSYALVLLPAAACAAILLWLGWRMWDALTLLEFPDETVSVVGAQMLQAGGRLYRDFVDGHGPLIFMLSQFYGVTMGWQHPYNARVISVVLAVLAGWTVALSPGLTGAARLWTVSLFAGWLAVVWLRQGFFMLSFYPVGGALAGIALAGFVIGAWRGERVPGALAFAAGLSLALLAATAYSFWPSALLFAVSGGWAAWRQGDRQSVRWSLAGLIFGSLGMLAYLVRFADLRGYLAFHIAESQTAYARYIDFSLHRFVDALVPRETPDWLVQGFAMVCVVGALVLFLGLAFAGRPGRPRHVGPILLGVFGVVLLNARGEEDFKDGSFVFAALVLAALAVGHALTSLSSRVIGIAGLCVPLLVAGAEWGVRAAPITPYNMDNATLHRQRRAGLGSEPEAPVVARIRALTNPDERILALVYKPWLYEAADRLPINGFYAYFPWDADYARAPWFGRPRDLCVTLAASPPPVIVFDDWHVWGHAPRDYMPCLFDILRDDYGPVPERWQGVGDLYIRRDRLTP